MVTSVHLQAEGQGPKGWSEQRLELDFATFGGSDSHSKRTEKMKRIRPRAAKESKDDKKSGVSSLE